MVKKTLSLLDRYNIDPEIVTIFVADFGEYEDYIVDLEKTKFNNVEIGVAGIGPQRNYIEQFYPEGTNLVMLDDDINAIETIVGDYRYNDLGDLHQFIQFMFEQSSENGAEVWGIFAARNSFFMSYKDTNKLCYIIGSFFGIVCRHDEELQRMTNHGEDYEYSIRRFIRDGAVYRVNYVTVDSNYYKEPGGLQLIRTPEYNSESILRIEAEFPEWCKAYQKKDGRAELKLKRNNPYTKL